MGYRDNKFFHATSASAMPRIKEQGLLPRESLEDGHNPANTVEPTAVYLAPSIDCALVFAFQFRDPVILEVKDIDRRLLAPDHERAGSLMIYDDPNTCPLGYRPPRLVRKHIHPRVRAFLQSELGMSDCSGLPRYVWQDGDTDIPVVSFLRLLPAEVRQAAAEIMSRTEDAPVMHYGSISPEHLGLADKNEIREAVERHFTAEPWKRQYIEPFTLEALCADSTAMVS